MKNLLIITGAGASFDVTPPDVPVDKAYQSPLTEQLFSPINSCLTEQLTKNPIAHQIGILRNDGPLEQYLRDVKEGKHKKLQQLWYWTIPLYLHGLFTAICGKYILPPWEKYRPCNYLSLILSVVSKSDYTQIIWLNLNYDLFADYAIEMTCSRELTTFDDYMNMKTKEDDVIIKYTKPHGSINWYKRKDNDISWDDIRKAKIPLDFENNLKEIYTVSDVINMHLNPAGKNTYPAISAPLGTYDYIYPKHIEAIKPDLKETKSILCIGFSAKDDDILKLLVENISDIEHLKIVNGSASNAGKAYKYMDSYFRNNNKEIGIDQQIAVSSRGFTSFLKSKEAEEWLCE